MEFTVHGAGENLVLEGPPGQPLIARAQDAARLVEACFEHGAHMLLLHAENLPDRFFDLSSGEAGEVLQKLRNYRIRLAVVRSDARPQSRLFGELLADEGRGSYFRLLDTPEAARAWLASA